MARDMERAERDLLSVVVELTGSQGGREARRGGDRNMVDCVGGVARAMLPWEGISMALVLVSYSRRLEDINYYDILPAMVCGFTHHNDEAGSFLFVAIFSSSCFDISLRCRVLFR